MNLWGGRIQARPIFRCCATLSPASSAAATFISNSKFVSNIRPDWFEISRSDAMALAGAGESHCRVLIAWV